MQVEVEVVLELLAQVLEELEEVVLVLMVVHQHKLLELLVLLI